VQLEALGQLKNLKTVGNRVRGLSACSLVPQLTTLPRVQCIYIYIYIYIYMCYMKDSLCGLVVRVPGYRSGGPEFDSRHYIKKVVGLERGSLSLVSATEELLGSNSSGSGLERREYSLGIRHADHVAPSIRKKLALTSPKNGGRSVGIVRLWTEAMEFFFLSYMNLCGSARF
jgi:hypothetical protein